MVVERAPRRFMRSTSDLDRIVEAKARLATRSPRGSAPAT
jgi:hypothetical protein